ncbi:hypothetical protein B0H11DRAFT_2183107 [Mycena galericulata]|nr:hypothetical protein B0H11DRAFT_2183107 [Mycena galericulata]
MDAPHPQNTTQISTLLLGEIFTNCAVGCPDAPLVLGAVSPLFRYIANTTPAAWSSLQLKLNNSTEADARERVRVKAKTTLVSPRAGVGVPAAAGKTETHAPAEEMRVPEALEVLRDHAGRISMLSLFTDTQAQARAGTDEHDAGLQSLCIDGSEQGTDEHGAGLQSLCIVASAGEASARLFPTIQNLSELETTNVTLSVLPAPDLGRLQQLRIIQPLVSAPDIAADVRQIEGRIADADRAGEVMTEAESEMGFLPQLAEINLRANVVPLLDQLVVPAVHTLHVCDLDGKDGSFRRQRRIRSLPEPDFRISSIP